MFADEVVAEGDFLTYSRLRKDQRLIIESAVYDALLVVARV